MNRVLSVITPVYEPRSEHLLAAYESLRDQQMPEGWSWEWLVQEDGSSGVAREILPADERIDFGTGRHNGVAITRNLALSRARGELVKNFDQDDLLTPGVLSRDIAALTDSSIGWTTSRVLDLLPDGKLEGFEHDPEEGALVPGDVFEHWRTHDYRLPVHPTTLCIRRDLAVELGGWMAVPGSDDTGLLVSASIRAKGWFSHEVGLYYRKWPGQGSGQTAHVEPIEWHARMHLIEERANVLAGRASSGEGVGRSGS